MRIMPSHPTSLRGRDSDDDDFRDRDYDVAALANNLSQAFRYGIYNNDDIEEAQGSHERDDESSSFHLSLSCGGICEECRVLTYWITRFLFLFKDS
ncbi:uncharacterized protein [Miscanthus floridulus]|uniref:uncharacterized protein isoform X2 n=1 Tax=Miscanthus floridulus TaxID=154761 RepID=UPI00345B3A0D